MENFRIISISTLLILVLATFFSCDKSEYDNNDLINEELSTPDTLIIDNTLFLKIENNEERTFSGIYLGCQDDANNNVNIVAYGSDLQVNPDGTATYNDDLFIFYWETENEIEEGSYRVKTEIESESSNMVLDGLANINVTEITEFYIKANFEGVYLDAGELVDFSGSFKIERFDCDIFGDDIDDLEIFEEDLSEGVSCLTFGIDTEDKLSTLGISCSAEGLGMDGDFHLQLIADLIFIDDDSEIDEVYGLQYYIYHRELEDLESGVKYEARFGNTSSLDELNDLLLDEEELNANSEAIELTYTIVEDGYVEGSFKGQLNETAINGTFMSPVFLCE